MIGIVRPSERPSVARVPILPYSFNPCGSNLGVEVVVLVNEHLRARKVSADMYGRELRYILQSAPPANRDIHDEYRTSVFLTGDRDMAAHQSITADGQAYFDLNLILAQLLRDQTA